MDKRRRNRCQYCRFQKCLVVGMVKEGKSLFVLASMRLKGYSLKYASHLENREVRNCNYSHRGMIYTCYNEHNSNLIITALCCFDSCPDRQLKGSARTFTLQTQKSAGVFAPLSARQFDQRSGQGSCGLQPLYEQPRLHQSALYCIHLQFYPSF